MSVMAIVRLNAHPGKGSEIRDLLNAGMSESTQKADGLLGLEIFVGDHNPDSILILEEWTSVEAHTRYVDSLGNAFDELMKLVADRDSRHYEAAD